MKFLIPILTLIPLLSFGFQAKFVHIKGVVKLDGTLIKDKKAPISKPAPIETGKDSLAIVRIGENYTLKINENSIVDLSGILEKTPSVDLKNGSIFSYIKKEIATKQRESFRLKAKDVAMGVRGTTFFASIGKKQDVWMCVKEGVVGVKTKKQNKETLVKAGEGIVARSEGEVSKPKPLPWTKKLNWDNDPESGDLTNTVSIEEAYVDLLDFDYD